MKPIQELKRKLLLNLAEGKAPEDIDLIIKAVEEAYQLGKDSESIQEANK